MIIKRIVASGCSQTADGIGGAPWQPHSEGGCSFVDRGDGTRATPRTWVSFLAQQLAVHSLVNLAAESHGNRYVSQTLIHMLSHNQYPREHTLILFNVSEPLRLDTPCAFDHPHSCQWVPYTSDVLPYSWISNRAPVQDVFRKNMGLEQVGWQSRTALISLMNFLQCQGYQYLFLTMGDYTQDVYIGDVVRDHPCLVPLDPGPGMIQFGQAHGMMQDDVHPTSAAHEMMAQQVLRRLRHDLDP